MKKTLLLMLITSSFFSFSFAQTSDISHDRSECNRLRGIWNDVTQKCIYDGPSGSASFDRLECARLKGVFDQSTGVCTFSNDISHDRSECNRLRGIWNDVTQKCIYDGPSGSASFDRLECARLKGVFDQSTGVCTFSNDISHDRSECNRLRGIWNDVTQKCIYDGPSGSASFDRLECARLKGVFDQSTGVCTFSNIGVSNTIGGTSGSSFNALLQFLDLLKNVVARLIPLLVGFAVLAFFWFLVMFIWKGAGDPAERAKMKGGMLWSIVAIFVMVSVWGIIGFISSVTGIETGGTMHGFKLPGQQ